MDVYNLALALVIIITLVATAALVLIYRVDHAYSGVLFNLTIVEWIHFVFSILYLLNTNINTADNDIYQIFLDGDLYAFSIICFSTSVVIVFGSVSLTGKLARTCYGIFFYISVCLIFGIEKILRKCICIDDNCDKLELKAQVQITEHNDWDEKGINKVVYCYGLIYHVMSRISLEYALIYVPASVLFYMTIRTMSTFNEWFSKSCMEKCKGCQFNVSFCNSIAITFLLVIWCLRPMHFLSVKFIVMFYDVSYEHDGIVPMVTLQAMFFVVLIYVIKVYGFGKNHLKTECLHKCEHINSS